MNPSPQGQSHSDYIIFVDESGDHGLKSIDPSYPVFVLAFCIIHKLHYCQKIIPAIHGFKFKHFGHDLTILHEHEIRKEIDDFRFASRKAKEEFLGELTELITSHNFILVACAIDKVKLAKDTDAQNPYHLALDLCLHQIYGFLQEKNQADKTTHIVFEKRGAKEDAELELEFRRICDGENKRRQAMPFRIRMADKKTNSAGLQLADLMARPIGLQALRPEQPNRAFQILRPKFFCEGGRTKAGEAYENYGLLHFP